MKERVVWVDWAKTLCIFFVVIGHVGPSFLKPFVYAFHVPAFFVISGYLYKKTHWYQTLISFLIPIVVFSIVNLFLGLYGSFGNNALFVYKLDDARPLFTGLWFLEVLFIGRLLLGDAGFSYIKNHYKLFAVLTIVMSVIVDIFDIEMTWYITRIIQCFPFLCMGIYLKEKNFFNNIPRTKGIIATAIGGGILFVILMHINQCCDIMYNRYNHGYILFFVNALLGSILLFYVCTYFGQSKIIEKLSIGTLAILGIHTRVARGFVQWFPFFWSYILSPIVSMVVAYLIIEFALRYCPIILGKIKFSINKVK